MIGERARHRITIKQDSSAAGDEAPDYTGTAYKLLEPAKIECISGQETYRGRQLESHVDYVVETRYDSGITPEMLVYPTAGIYTGLTLNIEFVQQVGYGRGRLPKTLMFCKTVGAT